MKNVIEISNLNKNFGKIKAVNDLSFKVKEGELFAFLGINGAGKSTTINIMCGQLAKDSGTVIIDGMNADKDIVAIKQELGVVFQNSVLDSAMSVYDNLECRAALYGITGRAFRQRFDELSDLLDFKRLKKRPLSKLSGGQRRRTDIARALLHKPRILILDEPTTGLHSYDVEKLVNILLRLRDGGNTVLVIEHNLDVIKVADYLIDLGPEGGDGGGTIVCTGSPEEVAACGKSYTGQFLKKML